MSTDVMANPSDAMALQRKAKIAAVFYLVCFVTGFAAFRLRGPLGTAANLIADASYVVVILLFYSLFERVNRSVSLLAASVGLAGCLVGALTILGMLRLPVNTLVIFGFYCLLIGWLIFHSTFMPRFIGLMMAMAGLAWLTFLSPSFAKSITPYNMAAGMLGELTLTLWLLIFGVKERA